MTVLADTAGVPVQLIWPNASHDVPLTSEIAAALVGDVQQVVQSSLQQLTQQKTIATEHLKQYQAAVRSALSTISDVACIDATKAPGALGSAGHNDCSTACAAAAALDICIKHAVAAIKRQQWQVECANAELAKCKEATTAAQAKAADATAQAESMQQQLTELKAKSEHEVQQVRRLLCSQNTPYSLPVRLSGRQ